MPVVWIRQADCDPLGQLERLRERCRGMSCSLRFNTSFWLLVVSCLVVYGSVLPFNNVASAFLITK